MSSHVGLKLPYSIPFSILQKNGTTVVAMVKLELVVYANNCVLGICPAKIISLHDT